ncbi:MAG: hypothetical protein V4695_03130 [Pseudomonadota bacterium]
MKPSRSGISVVPAALGKQQNSAPLVETPCIAASPVARDANRTAQRVVPSFLATLDNVTSGLAKATDKAEQRANMAARDASFTQADTALQSAPAGKVLHKLDLPIDQVLHHDLIQLLQAHGTDVKTSFDDGKIDISYDKYPASELLQAAKILRANFAGRYGPVNIELDATGESVERIGGVPVPSRADLEYLTGATILHPELMYKLDTRSFGTVPPGEAVSFSGWTLPGKGAVEKVHIGTIYANSVNKVSACPSIDTIDARLNARAAVNDLAVWRVRIGSIFTIDILPGQQQTIFTPKIEGSTVVAIVSKHPDGKRSATISHRSPVTTDRQVQDLDREIDQYHGPRLAEVKYEAFILTPGDFTKTTEGNWEIEAKQRDVAGKLIDCLKNNLPGTKPTMIAYSESMELGRSSAFVLEIPAAVEQPVRYDGLLEGRCKI